MKNWHKIEKENMEIIASVRANGAEIENDAQVLSLINDDYECECYAIEDANDFVFWCDGGLFTPDNREELIEQIVSL